MWDSKLVYVTYCTRKSPNSTYDSELSLVTPSLRLRGGATLRTLADGLVVDPVLNDGFELCAEVRAVERVLADDRGLLVLAGFAVPAQTVWVFKPYANKKETECATERYLPIEPSGRTRSTTIPMVFANRTGLCGVLPTKRDQFKHCRFRERATAG